TDVSGGTYGGKSPAAPRRCSCPCTPIRSATCRWNRTPPPPSPSTRASATISAPRGARRGSTATPHSTWARPASGRPSRRPAKGDHHAGSFGQGPVGRHAQGGQGDHVARVRRLPGPVFLQLPLRVGDGDQSRGADRGRPCRLLLDGAGRRPGQGRLP